MLIFVQYHGQARVIFLIFDGHPQLVHGTIPIRTMGNTAFLICPEYGYAPFQKALPLLKNTYQMPNGIYFLMHIGRHNPTAVVVLLLIASAVTLSA